TAVETHGRGLRVATGTVPAEPVAAVRIAGVGHVPVAVRRQPEAVLEIGNGIRGARLRVEIDRDESGESRRGCECAEERETSAKNTRLNRHHWTSLRACFSR